MPKAKQGVYSPWYDTDKLCIFNIVFMGIVNFFGWSGLVASFSRQEWNNYWHIPVFLIVSSCFVFLSTALRLFVRHFMKKAKEEEPYL